jgi:hypothetical protein
MSIDYLVFVVAVGLGPTLLAGFVLGFISSTRGHKFASGFAYGAFVGAIAYLPWAFTNGLASAGLFGGVLGMVVILILSKKKFPKITKPYQKLT